MTNQIWSVRSSKNMPNFFILGAPKCGTTALYYYLSEHPEIYMSPKKEPHYFDDDSVVNKGVKTRSEYVELFRGAENYRLRGGSFNWVSVF